jgi:hypothetical protein
MQILWTVGEHNKIHLLILNIRYGNVNEIKKIDGNLF